MDRKVALQVVIFIAIVALLAVIANAAYSQPGVAVRGAQWDESLWSAVSLPDSALVCRIKPDGSIGCIAVPRGTVVLIPTPSNGD